MLDERRRQRRSRLLQRGTIVFRDGCCTRCCVVLDLSSTGAKLKLAALIGLPDRFELRLDNGLVRLAEVVHRAAGSMGIRFIDRIEI